MDTTNLIAWLPFDESTTQDFFGNTWTATGNATLSIEIKKFGASSVHLPNGARLTASNVIDINADKWTFDCWCYLVSSSSDEGYFALSAITSGNSGRYGIVVGNDGVYVAHPVSGWQAQNANLLFPSVKNQWVHLAIVKNGTNVTFYQDGQSVWSFTTSQLNNNGTFILGGDWYGYNTEIYFDSVRFYEGTALWTANFTPPTADEYEELAFQLDGRIVLTVDVERRLTNSVEIFFDVKRKVLRLSKPYVSFTGNSGCYAALPLSLLPNATTFTIEAEFSTTSKKNYTNNYQWATIAGREITNYWQNDFGFCVNNGKLCFWAEPTSGGSNSTKNTTSSATVNNGAVHKVAVVSDGGAIDLYCDGVNVAHTDNVNAKITNAYSILLGYNTNANSYLQMDLYEARFWNVARTQEQIFADIDGTETGLQGWYLPSSEGLKDYSGNARHATLYGNPVYTESTVTLNCDVERRVKNDSLLLQTLKVWLPFDSSPTEDLCGNEWTATGSPTVGASGAISGNALQLDGSSYVQHNGSISLGGKDFTICGWATMNTATAQQWAGIFDFDGYTLRIIRNNYTDNSFEIRYTGDNLSVTLPSALTSRFHFEMDYQHSTGKWFTFFNGALVHTYTGTLARRTYTNLYVGHNGDNYSYEGRWGGSIDEFQIYDGVALHTENFTPPTAEDYFGLKRALNSPLLLTLSFDVARRLSNRVAFSVDVARVITNSRFIGVNQSFDVVRNIVKSVSFNIDVRCRAVNRPVAFNIDIDVARKVKKLGKLRAWLPFDNSVTEDLCGNTWTTSGNPTIGANNAFLGKALQLDGSSYVQLNKSVTLGGKDFTICGWVNMSSATSAWGTLFEATTSKGGIYRLEITRYSSNDTLRVYANEMWGFYRDVNIPADTRFYLELDYQHSAGKLRIFIDGTLAATVSKSLAAKSFVAYTIGWGTKCTWYFTGTVDEFQIYDGVALHTENFTPTVNDCITQRLTVLGEADIFFTVDVQRKIKNAPLTWRYENAGDADDLILTAPILTDLPATKSKTGTAFYQTTRAKCFDLPATQEIWMKFDVYFNGSNRWRAYNGGNNGTTGITAQTDNEITYFVNGNEVHAATNAAKTNQLQTVLLHMVSGSSAGVIEAWVDGTHIYTYTGDVNHGEEFADIYLQSDGSGTFFSNVIISNSEIDLDETLGGKSVVVLFDVEISIGRLISLYLDTKCIVITQDVIEQLAKFSSALKVWLPFDTSSIADVCSNEWLAYGDPTIQNKELVLDGSSYLKMYPSFTITRGQTFTVGCWFSTTSNTTGTGLWLWNLFKSYSYGFFIGVRNTLEWAADSSYTTVASTGVTDGKEHYLEAVFDSGKKLVIALDGVRVAIITESRLPNYWENDLITTSDYEVAVGCNLSYYYPTSGAFIGMIDEFQIYDGIALHGGSYVSPIEASYTALHSKILENPINVTVDVMRLVKDDTVLKVHLTFDDDVTTDECGNEWTVVGNPTISEEHAIKGKALQLDGEGYLKCNSTFTIEERQPFTIDCWIYAEKAGQLGSDSTPLWSLVSGDKKIAFLVFKNTFVDSDKQVYHCAMVSDGLYVYQFVDGTLVSRTSLFDDVLVRQIYTLQNAELYVGHCPNYNNSPFTGTIDEFRLIIGDALWTEPFTPSVTGEISDWSTEVTLNCDIMYIVNNVEEPWIYYNIGIANGLLVEVSSQINLPANCSRTGCAIYGDEIRFPVPTTYNFWIRFDFTPQGLGFFVSEHKSKNYGVFCTFHTNTSRTTAFLYIVCDSYYGSLIPISGNATNNESATVLHTVLLHIKSGLTDGIVEAWVDKTENGDVNYLIERYVGNVNDGVPIYDFYIHSPDYFSNIIISNEPITFESVAPETHIIEFVLDVERQLTSNFVTYNLDIIRNVIAPITIPLSGENIEYTLNRIRICSIPQKFILPKISRFYIYGDLVGKIHIYSDTNVEGIINGSYYFTKNSIQSEFIESNEFYIVLDTSIISAQDVIKLFIYKLVTNRLSGTSALNRAVIYATDGRYVSWNDFINQFLNCLNSIDYKRFLDFYCDIILDNNDTGAILGWDAGGVTVRTAINVVTESSSTDAWNIPNLGSSIMISNLLVHFPQYGASGNLTNLEKYILSGLNSEWIYRSLELIKYSFGISFENSNITYEMYIKFSHDSSSGALAYTSAGENDTSCILTINMYYYSSMDITDVNGLSEHTNMYLDRTIVHELVHAVMELRSYAHYTLPTYITEGLAELVHGIDDSRKNNIVDLLTTRKNDLISALTSEQYAYPEDAYSVGYILLRFLAKQGQHINNMSSNKLIINNLLVVNDLSLVIKTVECDVTTVINNYVITQCDVTTVINNYVIIQCDVTINHYMIIEYVLDVYCECVVSVVEFISVQINVMCLCTISVDVFRRIIGLNVTKFNIMMYGVSNVHMNSVTFNIIMYGVLTSISSSIKFVIVDPSKTRTKLHQCIKPVVMLMVNPVNNIMISDQVSDLALRSTPLYPDRSNKGYNTRG